MALNRSPESKSSNPKPSSAQLFGTLRPPFEQLYYAMLNTKLKASEPSGSKAEDCFHIFLCIAYVRSQVPLVWGHFGP